MRETHATEIRLLRLEEISRVKQIMRGGRGTWSVRRGIKIVEHRYTERGKALSMWRGGGGELHLTSKGA